MYYQPNIDIFELGAEIQYSVQGQDEQAGGAFFQFRSLSIVDQEGNSREELLGLFDLFLSLDCNRCQLPYAEFNTGNINNLFLKAKIQED
jgi:hypothetical protein